MFRLAHLLFGPGRVFPGLGLPPGLYRSRWRQHRAYRQAMRARRPFRSLIGMAWGMFWVLFAMSVAFGGPGFRHFLPDALRWVIDFWRNLLPGVA